jgi:hypothetical protein
MIVAPGTSAYEATAPHAKRDPHGIAAAWRASVAFRITTLITT